MVFVLEDNIFKRCCLRDKLFPGHRVDFVIARFNEINKTEEKYDRNLKDDNYK